MLRRGRCPPQSPAPGFGEKYWSLSGFPSHSLESGGGAFLIVIFGQIFAYSVFSDRHFSSPGAVSGLIASTGHSGSHTPRTAIVIDDGIATGATTRAALRATRMRKPTK